MEPVQFALSGRLTVTIGDRSYRPAPTSTTVLARLLLADVHLVTTADLNRALRPDWNGPLRPGGDRGGLACALVLLAAGTVLVTTRGTADRAAERF